MAFRICIPRGIVHADLKKRMGSSSTSKYLLSSLPCLQFNILVSLYGEAQIADFGLSHSVFKHYQCTASDHESYPY